MAMVRDTRPMDSSISTMLTMVNGVASSCQFRRPAYSVEGVEPVGALRLRNLELGEGAALAGRN